MKIAQLIFYFFWRNNIIAKILSIYLYILISIRFTWLGLSKIVHLFKFSRHTVWSSQVESNKLISWVIYLFVIEFAEQDSICVWDYYPDPWRFTFCPSYCKWLCNGTMNNFYKLLIFLLQSSQFSIMHEMISLEETQIVQEKRHCKEIHWEQCIQGIRIDVVINILKNMWFFFSHGCSWLKSQQEKTKILSIKNTFTASIAVSQSRKVY